MIIFGTRSLNSTRGRGLFTCPRCSTQRSYRLIGVNRWFTLYFIPVIPLGRVGQYVECESCAGTFAEEVLGLYSGGFAPPSDPFMDPSSPFGQPGKPGYGYAPPQTSALAVISLVLGALSPVFLCACGLSLITSLGAILCGHLSLSRIKRSAGMLTGQGMAVAGLVLGYLFALASVAFLALFIPGFVEGWNKAQQNQAVREDFLPPDIDDWESLAPDGSSSDPDRPSGFQPPEFVAPDLTPPGGWPSPAKPPVPPVPPQMPPVPSPPAAAHAPLSSEYVVQEFPGMGWTVNSLAFSPDGKKLAAGKLDRAAVLFEIESGDRLGEQTDLNELGQIMSLSFASDGKQLFLGGYSGGIGVWDLDSDRMLAATEPSGGLTRHGRIVRCLALSSDNSFLVTG